MSNRTLQFWDLARLSFSKKKSGGVTLVEVLVSIGIFTVLTGVVLSNYRGYNTNALFANASEDIVLALRQAQVYGVGVKKDVGGSFTTPYGVWFLANTNSLIIFADNNSNGLYGSADDTIIETITWPSNIKIRTAANWGGFFFFFFYNTPVGAGG